MTQSASPLQNATQTKLYGLDHLRTLAITLVLVYHYGRIFPHPEWTNTYSKFGWTGVDLFFVLSGYLIASQLFATVAKGHKISVRDFYVKRFFRIIPAYLLVVILYFSFPFIREREALAPLWKYLSFTQNLRLDLRTQGTFSHAWSLCIEEQFYLFFPIIIVLLGYFKLFKKGYLVIIALFMAGFIIRISNHTHFVQPCLGTDDSGIVWHTWIYYPTYCRLDGLLAGVTVAAVFRFFPLLKQRISKYGNALLVLSLLILVAAYIVCLDEESFTASVFGFPLVSIGYGCMVAGAVSESSFLFRLKSAFTAKIASLSYALYLVHKFVIHLAQQKLSAWGIDTESNLMFLLCILICILAALLVNTVVEKPFLRMRSRYIKTS